MAIRLLPLGVAVSFAGQRVLRCPSDPCDIGV
jgi:hypothetical protein